jgi:hypothetical protein
LNSLSTRSPDGAHNVIDHVELSPQIVRIMNDPMAVTGGVIAAGCVPVK